MSAMTKPRVRALAVGLLGWALAAAGCTSPTDDGDGAGGAGGTTPGAGGTASGQGGGPAGTPGSAGHPGTAGATGGSEAGRGGGPAGSAGGPAGASGRGGATGGSAGAAAGAGGRGGAVAGSGGRAGDGAAGGRGGASGSPGAGGSGAHVCGMGAEDQNVVLSCPAGQVITSVVYAGYGTTTGACGAFAAGACKSADAVEIVRTFCVGRQSCTVSARNDVFGDPCNKTVKALAVEVACGAGPASNGCPFSGHVSYTLTKSANPSAAEADAYARITVAMDAAVANYNCYANLTKATTVTYNPSVETADGNVNGSIRFGPSATYMTMPTSMHEIAHTLGVGSSQFAAMVSNGIFTGTNATTQLREITGIATDQVHSDGTHFWPYGLNYDSEYHDLSDAINNCKLVSAIRKDIGLN
jgi:hypothetical protein